MPPAITVNNARNDSKGLSLVSRLLAHDDSRSEIYTYIAFCAAPIIGSVGSFLVNLAAAGGVLEVLRGVIGISRDRFLLYLTLPIYLYCASYLLSLAANPAPGWDHVLPVLTFLLFPFLYSSWCLSK